MKSDYQPKQRNHCVNYVQKSICISNLESYSDTSFMCYYCFLFLYRYWLSVGAQPSDPVQRLLFRAGLLPPPPMVAMGRKGGPRDTRPVDPLSGRVLTPKQPTKTSTESAEV
ncbi:putative ribosomal protein S16 [Helianthus annuus]|nr:putative ribosomal protein S16 [Helianthus annuus]